MRYLTVVAMAIVLTASAEAYDWKVAEIGGTESLGSPYEGGEVKFNGGSFTITSTGGDLWSKVLGITLAYVQISGDFTIQYTIEEHTSEPSAVWSKCGAMVMQDLEPDAPYVFVQSACSNNEVAANEKGSKIVTRPERGGVAAPSSGGWAPLRWPVTYKLVREGDLFTASVSLDGGRTFESLAVPAAKKEGSTTLELDDPVILGIAASGDENGIPITTTATISRILINGMTALAVEPASKLATRWGRIRRVK